MDVVTNEMDIFESEDELRVNIKYTLDINHNFVSECEVHFTVQAR